MKAILALLAWALLAPLIGRGDDVFTQAQFEAMQRKGWFTPAFQAATRELIDAKQLAKTAESDHDRLEAQMPGLQTAADAEDAKIAQLKAELARYDHPDETDYTALQNAMKDASARTEDQLARAQAYVWTYPGGAHTAEAEQDLRALERKIADQVQAAKDADAAQTAAQLKLLQRVKARDLSLGEWRAFLQDKSQDQVTQYLGAPATRNDDYWTYPGAWTVDPSTNLKAGLQLTFNGGRVQSVAPIPAQ